MQERGKKVLVASLGLIVLVGAILGILPPNTANAAPSVTWINRGTVKVDSDYFVDANPTDVTLEYIGTPAALEGCPAKIVFDITAPDRSSQGAYTNFFFKDGYNNNAAAKAQYQAPGGGRDVNNKLVCDFGHKENVAVGATEARRVTFIRMDADTIVSYKNNIVFKKTPVDENVFRRTTENDPCKDAIYTQAARVQVGGVIGGPWPNGTIVDRSAMLYALQNGGGGRTAESYADIMRRTTDSAYTDCGIDNQDLYSNGVYAAATNVGNDERSVQFQIANGVKTNGEYYQSGAQDDDTFVIFIGNPTSNLPSNPSTGQPVPPTSPPATTLQPVCEDEASGMAFILCPVIRTIQNTFQFLFTEFIHPFLGITPAGSLDGLRQVWQNVLGLANIAFIIVFFIIIFSQATSIGITNYGIKRMLPRLIIVAILSNLSFYICAFLIDFANILGVGISSLILIPLQGLGAGNFQLQGSTFEGLITLFAGFSFAGAALAASGGIIAGVFSLAIIIGILLLVAILLLIVRQVLIFTYVVFSPLIFVGFILPGTARIAGKVTVGFLNLLWVGPIVMGMMALSGLIVIIIQSIPVGA